MVVVIVALFSLFQGVLQPLCSRPQQIVLAYSGGLDSHVLLHLLARYKQQYPQHEYLAVHVHHGLSSNADTWLAHCQQTAQTLDINFVAERVTLTTGNRTSLEAIARSARYDAIAQHLRADSLLLLGQHLDDQFETFLLQLKRGAGIKGLSAMAQVMPFALHPGCQLCRPLLTQTQQSLVDYAQAASLHWVEDESNQDQRYDRNFLRHDIIPRLKQRWPQIASAVHRSAELCAEQQQLADEVAGHDLASALSHPDRGERGLRITKLTALSKIRRNNLLRFWLAQQKLPMPSRQHLALLWQEVVNAGADANPQLTWQGGVFRRFQDVLYNVPLFADLKHEAICLSLQKQCVELPDGLGSLNITWQDGYIHLASPLLSVSVLAPCAGQRITIGFRGQGKCQPLGRKGSRSIKKLYQEYQVAPWLRDRIPLLYYDDELVCAIGLWVCQGYQIAQD